MKAVGFEHVLGVGVVVASHVVAWAARVVGSVGWVVAGAWGLRASGYEEDEEGEPGPHVRSPSCIRVGSARPPG